MRIFISIDYIHFEYRTYHTHLNLFERDLACRITRDAKRQATQIYREASSRNTMVHNLDYW
jgi:hypothetical protein